MNKLLPFEYFRYDAGCVIYDSVEQNSFIHSEVYGLTNCTVFFFCACLPHCSPRIAKKLVGLNESKASPVGHPSHYTVLAKVCLTVLYTAYQQNLVKW